MASFNQICDNVTTCDNLIFAGCHAVSACFARECDNVTTKTAHTHIRARTCTHHFTMSQMSQCHKLLKNKDLECDNLQAWGCHVVTPYFLSFEGLTRCVIISLGHSSTIALCVTTLVMRFQSIKVKVKSAVSFFILPGIQLLKSLILKLSSIVGASAAVLKTKPSDSAKKHGLEKKVLLRGSGYGSMMRGIALYSDSKIRVSFRFSLLNQRVTK